MRSTLIQHVNFMPEKEKRARLKFALNYFWILMTITVFVAGAVGFSLLQKHRITVLQRDIDRVNEENARTKETQLKQQQAKLSESVRKEALGDPIFWSSLLQKVALKIPQTIKITQLNGTLSSAASSAGATSSTGTAGSTGTAANAATAGSKRIMTMKGTSPFLLPIYRLKDNFDNLKECPKPSLVSIEQAQSPTGEDQLSFQIECTLL